MPTPPSATVRSTPTGSYLRDGSFSKITFAADADVSFWENTVTPPGVDGGEKVDTTTMFNTTYSTGQPQALKTMTAGSASVAYDPRVLPQIIALINVRTVITVTFPSGTTWALYGYLQKFEPQEIQRGQMPMANVAFETTNTDPSNVESGPAMTGTAL